MCFAHYGSSSYIYIYIFANPTTLHNNRHIKLVFTLTINKISSPLHSQKLLKSTSSILRLTRIFAPLFELRLKPCTCTEESDPGVSTRSYLRSKWHMRILTSFAAKKRPGHACCPWPNLSYFSLEKSSCPRREGCLPERVRTSRDKVCLILLSRCLTHAQKPVAIKFKRVVVDSRVVS